MNKTTWAPRGLLMGWMLIIPLTRAVGASARIPLEIQIEVTEVDNRKASSLGVEWLDTIQFAETQPAGLVAVGSFERLTALHSMVQALVEEGAAEVLAKPNLITDSGTVASFRAGGQIPYATTSSLGSSHVEFKPYGVAMSVRPVLLKSGRIELKVDASISAPDPTNAVTITGTSVPALLERTVTSHVTMDQGSTMTLAGLVQSHREQTVRGVPILRRIPLLGVLFRWRHVSTRKTTVIVFVTPRKVTL